MAYTSWFGSGATTSETPEHDPRYERAQTLEGAQARYAAHDNGYDEADLERDLERILERGEYPDRERSGCDGLHIGTCPSCPTEGSGEGRPAFEGQAVMR